MRVSLYVTSDAIQVNLEPESDHEREGLAALSKYVGPATIHRGVNISQSQGGYLRDYGERQSSVAITIKRGE